MKNILSIKNKINKLESRNFPAKLYAGYFLVYKYLSKNLSDNLNRELFIRFELSFKEALSGENKEIYEDLIKTKALDKYGYFIQPEYTFINISQEKDSKKQVEKFQEAFKSLEFKNTEYNNLYLKMDLNSYEKISQIISLLDSFDINLNKNTYLNLFNKLINDEDYSNFISKFSLSTDSIYTPFLNKSINTHLNLFKKFNKIYCQDFHENLLAFIFFGLLINNINLDNLNINSNCYLTNKLNLKNKIDFIFADLRYGLILNKKLRNINLDIVCDERFKNYKNLKNSNKDILSILTMIHYLKNDGIMLVLINPHILFQNNKTKLIRKELIENNLLDSIIKLPTNIYNDSYLLIFKKNKLDNNILFIDSANDNNEDKIYNTYSNSLEIENYSRKVSFNEILDNDFNLSINRYIYEIETFKPVTDYNKKINKLETSINDNYDKLSFYLDKLNDS